MWLWAAEGQRPTVTDLIGAALAIVGHSRLATNGTQSNVDNNQPVIVNGAVGIHNGIIVNDEQLWQKHPELRRQFLTVVPENRATGH